GALGFGDGDDVDGFGHCPLLAIFQYGLLHRAQRFGSSFASHLCPQRLQVSLRIFAVTVLIAMHRSVHSGTNLSRCFLKPASLLISTGFCTDVNRLGPLGGFLLRGSVGTYRLVADSERLPVGLQKAQDPLQEGLVRSVWDAAHHALYQCASDVSAWDIG